MSTNNATATDPDVSRWLAEINRYESKASQWQERGKKIVRRYKDEREGADTSIHKYNVLWSNLQVLLPAVYARCPKVEVERRYRDADPAGRVASEILERALTFTQQQSSFHSIMQHVVLDRMLCGRGVAWVRYVPHFRDAQVEGTEQTKATGAQMTDDGEDGAEEASKLAHVPGEQPDQVVEYEECVMDYVHWTDFGHTGDARVWEEVTAIWRRVYPTRAELVKRFGEEIGNAVPLAKKATSEGTNSPDASGSGDKAIVYEVWDKASRTAIWVCKDFQRVLDKRADPLKLEAFFPCPSPLFATLANDTCIPVPDYAIYQDQAEELDDLTARINALVKAVKVVGIYDASAQGIERMLSSGVENQLIPVKDWPRTTEKGGIDGVIQWLPLEQAATALLQLYEAREKVKQEMYEITGMSDILRGANDPSETATATRTKGAFASIRLRAMQDAAASFARDLLALAGEVMASHFSIGTLTQISAMPLMSDAEKQFASQAQLPAGQELPPAMAQALKDPSSDQVDALLKNQASRTFRIDIETDSTIGEDEQQSQQQRMAFLEAVSRFLQQAVPAAEQNPTIAPLLGEMLMFAVRSFKIGRSLEGAFQETLEKLQQMAANPQQKPDPEQIKAESQMQAIQAKAQADMQVEQMRAQTDMQIANAKLQADKELEQFKAHLQAQVAISEQAAQAQEVAHQNALEAQRDILAQQFEEKIEQMRLLLEEQRSAADRDMQLILAHINNTAKIEVAEIAAGTALQTAQISAAAAAERGDDAAVKNGVDD